MPSTGGPFAAVVAGASATPDSSGTPSGPGGGPSPARPRPVPSPAARTAVPTTRPIGHRLVGPVRAGVRSLSLVLDLDGEEDPDDIRSDPVRPFGDLAGRRGPAWLRLVIDVLARERPRLSGRKAERWLETSRRDVTTGRHVLCHPDEPDTGLVRRRHARLAHSGDSQPPRRTKQQSRCSVSWGLCVPVPPTNETRA